MNSEWEKVKLGDYCDKIGSGATPRGGSKVYLDSGEIALVRSQNIYNHGFEYDGLVYIDEKAAAKLSNVALQENDVLINITGDSVARVCMVPEDVLPARVNQHVSILRTKNNSLDPQFLRYALVNFENQYKLFAIASAGGTRKAITKGHLEEFEISLPDLDYQNKISEILSTFDQIIQLNQQTNETLEVMAEAIFKSWFVDFDPVRAKLEAKSVGRDLNRAAMAAITGISMGQDWDEIEAALDQKLTSMTEAQKQQLNCTAQIFPDELVESEIGEVPKGWRIDSVFNQAEYINGAAFHGSDFSKSIKGLPVIKIAELKSGISNQTKFTEKEVDDKFHIDSGDVLFSWSGNPDTSIDIFLWYGGPGLLNQHIFKIESDNKIRKVFNYYFLKSMLPFFKRTAANKQTTGLGHVTQRDLKRKQVAIPSEELIKSFSKKAEPMFDKIFNNLMETENLSSLRDTLLPKLISGELEIINPKLEEQ